MTARLGPAGPDTFGRARLADTLPESDPSFGEGFERPVADPASGRIGYSLGDPRSGGGADPRAGTCRSRSAPTIRLGPAAPSSSLASCAQNIVTSSPWAAYSSCSRSRFASRRLVVGGEHGLQDPQRPRALAGPLLVAGGEVAVAGMEDPATTGPAHGDALVAAAVPVQRHQDHVVAERPHRAGTRTSRRRPRRAAPTTVRAPTGRRGSGRAPSRRGCCAASSSVALHVHVGVREVGEPAGVVLIDVGQHDVGDVADVVAERSDLGGGGLRPRRAPAGRAPAMVHRAGAESAMSSVPSPVSTSSSPSVRSTSRQCATMRGDQRSAGSSRS